MSGLLLAAACAGVGLWYTTERAYYEEVTGVTEVMAYGDAFPVTNYRGIDADTSPLKMRACFNVDWDYFPTDEYKTIATPLIAPRKFDCFDARAIGEDLLAGNATAILSDENKPFGFDTFIAQYEDGRAFMWRQMNKCGDAHFGGDDLPEGCPDPSEDKMEKKPGIVTGGIGPVDVEIKLMPNGSDTAEAIVITDADGTSDNSDPDSFWACFKTDMSLALITETYQIVETVTPKNPLSSLPCFDAQKIIDDVQSGDAVAVLGENYITVDRMVAIYADGRGYAWHQRKTD